MNRITFAALCALLIALAAVLCVGVARAQDIPPPPMQEPALVDVSPSGLQSLWWFETLPNPQRGVGQPCDAPWLAERFRVMRGTVTATCVNADGRARLTWLVEGRARLVLWGETVLEDTRGRVAYLPLVTR